MALLKQQQQQAARVNSPTMPINVPPAQQQQAASQLMKRPLSMHEDAAYTASQLFAQQPSGGDPHEHSTSQQTANTDNMGT